MDNETIARQLKGFEAVWKRVGEAKAAPAANGKGKTDIRLMPGKNAPRRSGRYSAR